MPTKLSAVTNFFLILVVRWEGRHLGQRFHEAVSSFMESEPLPEPGEYQDWLSVEVLAHLLGDDEQEEQEIIAEANRMLAEV